MRSISLKLNRTEFISALETLGVTRRRRFSSIMPVWLKFVQETSSLDVVEEGGVVTASIPATGEWPIAGSTIDLFMLKRSLQRVKAEFVELHALEDAVLFASDNSHVKLHLLGFGPEKFVPGDPDDRHPLADLPLFRWAKRRRQAPEVGS
jgi:hypothetical protein